MKHPTFPARTLAAFALIFSLILGGAGNTYAVLSPSPVSAAAFADVPETVAWRAAVDRLTRLEIISGSTDGLFHPEAGVTREQFAKMAVTSANLATADNIRKNSTSFADVPSARWSSGYVRTAAQNSLLTGFPDGRFHPADAVTYAQALSISLRMLGYSDTDLTGIWPQNVLTKAAALKLTSGFTCKANDPMSRKDCAVLLDRLLDTDVNPVAAAGTGNAAASGSASSGAGNITETGSTSSGTPYAESTGLFSEVVILADSTVDRTLDTGEFRTEEGVLTNSTESILQTGHDYLVKLDGTIIVRVYGFNSYVLSFPVADVSDGTLYYRTAAGTTPLVLTPDMTFFDGNGILPYGNVFTDVRAGEIVSLSYESADESPAYLHFTVPALSRTGTYMELLILDTDVTSEDLSGNRILTDKGLYTLAVGIPAPVPGARIGAVANGTVLTGITGQVNRTEHATILQSAGTTAVLMKNGTKETGGLPLDTVWYHDGLKIQTDSLGVLLSRNSSIVFGLSPSGEGYEYALLYDPVFSSPQIADQQEIYDMTLGAIDLNNATLTRAGDLIAVNEIKLQDIAYEVTDIWHGNRYVDIYTSQIIGAIEAYVPNRFSPQSIQVSVYNNTTRKFESKTYGFSPEFAVSDLSGTDFQIGDSAIMLLGRDGKIIRMLK